MNNKLRLVFALVLTPAALLLTAASTGGSQHWTSEQLTEIGKTLPAKMTKVKVATDGLASWGNSSMSVVHREGDGQAEFHETQADIIIIRGGDANFILGGKIPDGKPSAAHEIRGSKIDGGERFPLRAGDVIHVPVNTPHMFLVEPGHKVDYIAIKVNQ